MEGAVHLGRVLGTLPGDHAQKVDLHLLLLEEGEVFAYPAPGVLSGGIRTKKVMDGLVPIQAHPH